MHYSSVAIDSLDQWWLVVQPTTKSFARKIQQRRRCRRKFFPYKREHWSWSLLKWFQSVPIDFYLLLTSFWTLNQLFTTMLNSFEIHCRIKWKYSTTTFVHKSMIILRGLIVFFRCFDFWNCFESSNWPKVVVLHITKGYRMSNPVSANWASKLQAMEFMLAQFPSDKRSIMIVFQPLQVNCICKLPKVSAAN